MAHITISFSAVVITIAALMLPLSTVVGAAPAIGMPNCETSCGNMSVPYPFGMGPPRCYWPGFNLTCDRTSNPPRLLLGDGTLQIVEEIFFDGWMTVVRNGDIKFDVDGNNGTFGGGLRDDGPYRLSGGNEFTLTGCNVQATLKNGNITMSSCSSLCDDGFGPFDAPSSPGSSLRCSGRGCCQAGIVVNNHEEVAGKRAYITSYDVQLKSLGWNRSVEHQWPARVFVATKGWFKQTRVSDDLMQTADRLASMEVPIWLDWEVFGHGTSSFLESNHTDCSHFLFPSLFPATCHISIGSRIVGGPALSRLETPLAFPFSLVPVGGSTPSTLFLCQSKKREQNSPMLT